MLHPLRRTGLMVVLALIAVLGLTACGSSSDDSSSAAGGSTASSGAGDGAASEALQTAYDGKVGTPPTEAAQPKPGINLWVISCGEQVPSCATPTAATKDAGEAAGWNVNVCDGQLNPNGWGSCIRQAISAKADALIPIGINCPNLQQPFQEAKDAGITVVGNGGVDCTAAGGPQLWASETQQLEGQTAEQTYNLIGQLAADWLIGKTDGKAKVLDLVFGDEVWGGWINDGLTAELATCDGCEVVSTLETGNADVGSGQLTQKFSTALLQATDANAVFVPIGGWMSVGLGQAVQSSGRAGDLSVITGLSTSGNYDLVRDNGGQNAAVGFAGNWLSWGAVDTAIRVLNGQETLPQGNGYQVVDADHGLPPKGEEFSAGVDFEAAYRKAWGV